MKNKRKYLAAGLMLISLALITNSFYMTAKAKLAQWLIASSWSIRDTNELPRKPWPWADTRPVARLQVPYLGVSQYIMQDASGESLAFGPGRMVQGSLPGEPGHALVAGHRDTHFEFLSKLEKGATIVISNYQNKQLTYQVENTRIIDVRNEQLNIDGEANSLTLITCYPFNSVVPNGPLRYVVEATVTEAVNSSFE